MTVDRFEQRSLACALVDVARPHLTDDDLTWLWVKIGAGDLESALFTLVGRCMRKDVTLPTDVAAALRDWLHGYVATEAALAFQPYIVPMPATLWSTDAGTSRRPSPTTWDPYRNRPRRVPGASQLSAGPRQGV